MDVSVENNGGLERKVIAKVPADVVAQKITAKVKQLGKKAKMPGFRPGKVPFKMLEQQFGMQARQDVYDDLFRECYIKALQEDKLEPAGGPTIQSMETDPSKDFEFVATFEVYPDVEVNYDGISVDKQVAEVSDEDVDNMIEDLRAQRKTWNDVERASVEGDQVTCDFEGFVGDEAFEGGKGDDVKVELGSGQYLPDFEKGLTGVKAGDEGSFECNFPEDYPSEELKGKATTFKYSVKAVAEASLPEIDEDFLQSFAIFEGGEEKLREQLNEHMTAEADRASRDQVKGALLDAVIDKNDVDMPTSMLAAEEKSIGDDYLRRMGMDPAALEGEQRPDLPEDMIKEEASRRVRLGLIFRTIVREQNLRPDTERVTAALLESAAGSEKPQDMIRAWRQNEQVMQQVESRVLEDQVVEFLMEKVTVNETTTSFKELVQQSQG